MKICVVGLGYMGLPMASLLANAGFDVVGVDINPRVVDGVNRGECNFDEKGMPELVKQAHQSGLLRVVAVPEQADAFILSLPTPVDHVTHAPDVEAVRAGAKSIAPVLKEGDLVVLESTVPVGATRRDVQQLIEEVRPDLVGKVHYVFCPERALPGNTLFEMKGNDRLIGSSSPDAAALAKTIYSAFCTGELVETSIENAEMAKVVENTSRDVQLAFANELALVCEKLGLNVWDVIELANRHPRVNILKPSTGVGGHCLAVDPWFIVHEAPELTPLIQITRAVNDRKPLMVAAKVLEAVAQLADDDGECPVKVACLGLAYKPNVDDLRESPSLVVVDELVQDARVEVMVVEPYLKEWINPYGLELVGLNEAVAKADVVVSLTGHALFMEMPEGVLRDKIVIDPCGIFQKRNDVPTL